MPTTCTHESDTDELEDEEQNNPRPRLAVVGPVWKHFTKRCEPEDGHTTCNYYCKLVLKMQTGTTTTLIRHLKRKHGDAFKLNEWDKNDNAELSELTANASEAKKSVTPSSQPSIAGFAKQGIKYKQRVLWQRKLTKKLQRF